MLKLTVSNGDKILIGDNILLEIETCSNKQTRIAFNAPKEIKIHTIFKDSSKQFPNNSK